MPSIRLYTEVELFSGASIALGPQQSHYINNVMRQKAGNFIRLFNGVNGEWRGQIKEFGRGWCNILVLECTKKLTASADVWLLFAPVKKIRIDFIASKSTELGASAIQPVFTEFTRVGRVNIDRLKSNAIEAAEQCGALVIPEVRETENLSQLINIWPCERQLLVCDNRIGRPPILNALKNVKEAGSWAILVGPEGGFSDWELDQIQQKANPVFVSLGPRILRADTAVVAALTCWQSVLGDWAYNIQ
ncbi:MAG: 16S rRNA (uracil(1498)-N(3))-methyltransferase [Pseudomonadota bacterium]|nr:16S rRNA (uracil(1498)-N(3))-methyltransferase [Pseudomonadota bacterium]